MEKYKTEYKDYSNYACIMVSTDRLIFNERSSVQVRMIEHSKSYKQLHIIVFSHKRIKPFSISPNCTVYSTGTIFRWNYVSSARKIGKRILQTIQKDIPLLISCQNPFETALVGKCLANFRKNSELLLQIHTDLFSPYFTKHSILNKINLYISQFTLPQAQVIRVVSLKIADSLVIRGISPERIIVKPIAVDIEYIKNAQPGFNLYKKYPQFKKIILMASRLESEKNIPLALNALKIVKEKIPGIGLVIVGGGRMLAALEKQAYNLKLADSVVFAGWQTDLIPYYKGSDVFLCTSMYEGYGMVLKEAEAAGCKIVSTDVGIAREIGANIADWSVESVADKIVKSLI
jgi:glycosyltransferase involved in cell wall biosynthesis